MKSYKNRSVKRPTSYNRETAKTALSASKSLNIVVRETSKLKKNNSRQRLTPMSESSKDLNKVLSE